MPDLAQYEKSVIDYFGELGPALFEEIQCLFCGDKSNIQFLFRKGSMNVVRCKCEFVFNRTPPLQEALDMFYQTSHAMQTWNDFKLAKDSQRQIDKFFDAVNYVKSKKIRDVLDIGCGTGFFLNMLRGSVRGTGEKRRLIGIDQGIKTIYERDIEFIRTDYASFFYENPGKDFDLISLWGVLEHVKDPFHLLKKCKQRLRENGKLIVCVPNCESEVVTSLWERCFTFCPQHLWYFNRLTLCRILRLCGFEMNQDYTIEPEDLPVVRKRLGYLPYKPYFGYAQEQIEKERIGLAEAILSQGKGYKIVAIGQHIGSGNNTRKGRF